MKRKGSIGGNPNPIQTPEFLAKQFPPAPDVPSNVKLGEPVAVALPLPIDTEVRRLKNRSIWLRRVITEAAQRELMGNEPAAVDVADTRPGDVAAAVAAPKRRGRKPKGENNA
ncbi:hypothetical protein RIF25_04960 [Thermosynechococcaceae cyanobacterium BACA0444]|uniref:Uncharacterized protein n=1 Tax=Pseudocalidococcus azoricus BACA0444 TaxID=2918990 RepID=A0AAE4FQ75_9CYAN|nr:hypothetical protein [Pseudocalidococcus azoricus]MDS3860150.1 hypothetical protein [Pseudocalidococcus azoricus BACA0444]